MFALLLSPSRRRFNYSDTVTKTEAVSCYICVGLSADQVFLKNSAALRKSQVLSHRDRCGNADTL